MLLEGHVLVRAPLLKPRILVAQDENLAAQSRAVAVAREDLVLDGGERQHHRHVVERGVFHEPGYVSGRRAFQKRLKAIKRLAC
jgi:hypothetical protein